MKNISPKIGISIVCSVLILLIGVVLISGNDFRKDSVSKKESSEFLGVESNENEQNVNSDEMQEDDIISDKSDVTEPSQEELTQSLQKNEESSKEKYEELFKENLETDNNSENNSNIDNGSTTEDENEKNLEDIEDVSVGYGPIS